MSENSGSRAGMLHAAVLAGGKSSRMNADKRFLELGGECLVDRALRLAAEAVRPSGGKVFLCGQVPGRDSLPDAVPGLGPLSGLQSALQSALNEEQGSECWLLVLPVDMPLVDQGTLGDLMKGIENRTHSPFRAVCYEGYEMPCLISVGRETKSVVAEFCAAGTRSSDRSIRRLFERVGVNRIPLPAGRKFAMINVNHPADWARVKADEEAG